MVKNRKLSRAISDFGWRQFRTLLAVKNLESLIDGNRPLKYAHVVVFVEAN